MDIVATILLALGALVVGVLLGWLGHAQRVAPALRDADMEVVRLRAQAESAEQRIAAAQARADEQIDAARERATEQIAAARSEQEHTRRQFQALAGDALDANSKRFLELAEERLKRSASDGEQALAKREEAVKSLVDPLTKAVELVRSEVLQAEKARIEGQGALVEQMRNVAEVSTELRNGTADLVTALRSSQTRGAWGELQLRKVVESAGMINRVDFTEQAQVTTDDGTLRPDMVINLAGGKRVVVDSKVAFLGFLEAQQSDDAAYREQRLDAHVRHMRKHVDDLAGKKYWNQFEPAPEFVVMFVPAEAFLSAALERAPELLEYAAQKNVIIATPTTMLALLRTVSYAWRQEALAENAQKVLTVGKELYARLVTMTGHVTKTGRALESATKSYNQMIGSLERNVLTSARRMVELDVVDERDSIDEVRGIEEVPRPITKPELLAAEEGGVVAIDRAQDTDVVLVQQLEVTELAVTDKRALEAVEESDKGSAAAG
ncbi:DNA recombination protein RmuC [Promicromonospora iranensis]|uniref:DNA recombination protein RmuC n=1 Tax=Promicromonospora iranensis TaxID=1105144 RepID=A0ABU2CLB5_9MICO|nr:DNA recombination protein RmuC [Promicromonospora iranensis]MDR7382135.1 DNA recombination protein RmuC [Promicromonospora iranensis]